MKMKFIFILAAALPLLATACSAPPSTVRAESAPAADGGDAQRLVALLDYVAADYGLAVQQGRVVSMGEYEEQVRFASDARQIARELAGSEADPLVRQVGAVGSLVAGKAPPDAVAAACVEARDSSVTRFGLRTSPPGRPSLETARALYAQACASCHGADGAADTEQAALLDPPPVSFKDAGRLSGLSPYRAYNALTFGVPGTGMASFESLDAAERWSLAFYVFRLGHEGRSARGPVAWPLAELSSRTDAELLAALHGEGAEDPAAALSHLRIEAPFQEPPAGAGIARTRGLVRRALATYRAGAAREADRTVLDAYLQGFEALEPRLRARDADGTLAVETRFRELRSAIARGDANQVQARGHSLDRALARLQDGGAAAMPALAAFLIYVREGAEAALVVGALLAGLRRLGRSDASRWVHAGWVAAVPAGALTWWLFERVVAVRAEHRELVEAIVALLASLVLFSVSFWMISRAESRHWLSYLQARLERGVSRRRLVVLAGLAFLAVYREAAETVLFTQAVLLDAAGRRGQVLFGCAAGLVAVAAMAVLVSRAAVRLPIGPFFAVSGVLLCALAVSFAGSGVYALVASGYLPPRPVPGPEVPWMGIYPDLTGLLVQSAIVALMAAAAVLTLRRRRATSPA